MIVTDKKYFLEEKLVEKLDLMIERLKGSDDNLLIMDGDEGQGKTNFLIGICYYVAQKTNRTYDPSRIFFDLDKLMKFASETEGQVIHWDEGALGGLSQQWWKKNQQKFIQLLMVARKKRHFWVIAIPKFYKLQEYMVVDRSIALIHVYSRKNIKKGRFFYYTKAKKELLFEDWKRRRLRSYNKFKSFGGSFLEYEKIVFSKEQREEYEKNKDKAIRSIVKDPDEKRELTQVELAPIKRQLFYDIVTKVPEITQRSLVKGFGVSERTGNRWVSEVRKQNKEGVLSDN